MAVDCQPGRPPGKTGHRGFTGGGCVDDMVIEAVMECSVPRRPIEPGGDLNRIATLGHFGMSPFCRMAEVAVRGGCPDRPKKPRPGLTEIESDEASQTARARVKPPVEPLVEIPGRGRWKFCAIRYEHGFVPREGF